MVRTSIWPETPLSWILETKQGNRKESHQPKSHAVTEDVGWTVQYTRACVWPGASPPVANRTTRKEKLTHYYMHYKQDSGGIKRFTCAFTSWKDSNKEELILWALILSNLGKIHAKVHNFLKIKPRNWKYFHLKSQRISEVQIIPFIAEELEPQSLQRWERSIQSVM